MNIEDCVLCPYDRVTHDVWIPKKFWLIDQISNDAVVQLSIYLSVVPLVHIMNLVPARNTYMWKIPTTNLVLTITILIQQSVLHNIVNVFSPKRPSRQHWPLANRIKLNSRPLCAKCRLYIVIKPTI